MIIDAHAHVYPTKIAEKATVAIGDFYDLKMSNKSGDPDSLLKQGKSAGVDMFLIHSVATKSEQVRSINEFIKSEKDKHKEFIGFMTLHQGLTEEEIFEEVKSCKAQGFKGIKLHPDFQKFYIDDENVFKIYRAAKEYSMPILLHTGDNRYEYSKPHRLAKVSRLFPENTFIAAHFGGYACWDEVDVYKGLENVFFDTSSSLAFISCEKAKELIYKFGVEKFFFGCDFPMWTAEEELKRFNAIDLTNAEREKILGKNIANLLKI